MKKKTNSTINIPHRTSRSLDVNSDRLQGEVRELKEVPVNGKERTLVVKKRDGVLLYEPTDAFKHKFDILHTFISKLPDKQKSLKSPVDGKSHPYLHVGQFICDPKSITDDKNSTSKKKFSSVSDLQKTFNYMGFRCDKSHDLWTLTYEEYNWNFGGHRVSVYAGKIHKIIYDLVDCSFVGVFEGEMKSKGSHKTEYVDVKDEESGCVMDDVMESVLNVNEYFQGNIEEEEISSFSYDTHDTPTVEISSFFL